MLGEHYLCIACMLRLSHRRLILLTHVPGADALSDDASGMARGTT